MKKDRGPLVYAIAISVAVAMFIGMCFRGRLFQLQDRTEILTALCNAFFVPGILMVGFGLLMWVANGGLFDIFTYGAHSLLVLFTPFRKPEKHEHYFDYKMRKQERRQKYKPRLIWVGLVMILLAGVCLIFYYKG